MAYSSFEETLLLNRKSIRQEKDRIKEKIRLYLMQTLDRMWRVGLCYDHPGLVYSGKGLFGFPAY
jgi:hypothetical protein